MVAGDSGKSQSLIHQVSVSESKPTVAWGRTDIAMSQSLIHQVSVSELLGIDSKIINDESLNPLFIRSQFQSKNGNQGGNPD